ncbi:YihY/virulence factor BrkB family protein [Limosilactobacillus sp.]|uniref:YihY/virulence factor BrkB family protein n=1 Tax=Limosilactobacillus sp. TaxID=2773925 RepID=UPI0035A1477E
MKKFMLLLLRHFQMAQLSSSAAVLAYYTLLSIFPAVLVVGNLLPMVGLNARTVLSYLQTAIPDAVYRFIQPFIYDFLKQGNGGLLTTGALIALWSTSQGIAAFQRSVNLTYGVARNQNPVSNRAISFIWMIVVLMIIFGIVFIYGIGEQLLKGAQPVFHFPRKYIYLFSSLRWPVTFTVLFVALILLYYFVPNAQVRLRYAIAGAFLATLLWMGLSRLFSFYAVIFRHSVISYKTIGAFIAMMVWLDFSGYVIMFGAVLNATLQEAHEGQLREREHFWQVMSRGKYPSKDKKHRPD